MDLQLQPVLDQFPAAQGYDRVAALGHSGGLSGALFWRVYAPAGELLLRQWPPSNPGQEHLLWIHRVLRHAAVRCGNILPVPCDGRQASVVRSAGHLWELTPWLTGAADYRQNPDPERVAAAMRALADFHRATDDPSLTATGTTPKSFETRLSDVDSSGVGLAGGTGAPAVTERLRRMEVLLRHGLQVDVTANPAISPRLRTQLRMLLAILPEALPLAIKTLFPLADLRLPTQPCIRDVWHDNVLFTNDEVTGLVDFGAMRVDTPAVDVARLLGSMAENDAQKWQIGMTAYASLRPLSSDELQAVSALDESGNLLGAHNWCRWLLSEGRIFPDQDLVAARIDHLLQRLRHFCATGKVWTP